MSAPPSLYGSSRSRSTGLLRVSPHCSLISCFASGLSCHALIQTASELQQLNSSVAVRDEIDASQDQSGSTADANVVRSKSKTLLNTVNVSVEVKSPVLQASMCALTRDEEEEKGSRFTGLHPSQSQLNFLLAQAGPPEQAPESKPPPDLHVCNLAEVGVRDASITSVAKIFHSEISDQSIFTWRHIQNYRLGSPTMRPLSSDVEVNNNRITFRASLPTLWSQFAAPHTGVPNKSTGGLDVLVLCEAVEAWRPWIEAVGEAIELVKDSKVEREKRVLVTILSIAARCPLTYRVSRTVEAPRTLKHVHRSLCTSYNYT